MTCRHLFLLPHLLLLVTIAGCDGLGRIPTASVAPGSEPSALDRSAPEIRSPGGASFYPLGVGNRWRYAGQSSKTFIPHDGQPFGKHGTWTRDAILARTELVSGREYVREEAELSDSLNDVHTVRWLRQDPSGLFELSVPPPGAPPFTETKLLAYPLHVGATWVVSNFPRTTATVEGPDVLVTPTGRVPSWRIRIRNSGHLPQEESFVWYGRAGYLGMKTHLQTGKPDSPGQIEIIEDQAESVTALHLVRQTP